MGHPSFCGRDRRGTGGWGTRQILVKSVSSEYILKNVSLPDAGCRCILVAPYPGRSSERLDPGFIERTGGDGVCKQVNRLPRSR
jgi:hypothetical protein